MGLENSSHGRIENLERQIEEFTTASQDREFTEYLQNLANRLRGQKYQVDLLQEELDANYRRYEERMRVQTYMQPQTQAQMQTQIQPMRQESTPPLSNSYVDVSDIQNRGVPMQSTAPAQNVASMQSTAPAQNVIFTQNVQKPAKKDNAEFIIGVTVLSVIGAAYILTTLVLLGMNYMNGFAKGMGLYAICIVVLAVSELVVYRRLPKFGCVFSAIGIGGLYLSTVLNFLVLRNFNLWVTLVVTMVITIVVVLLSRKRDSLVYRIIGMIAGYLCFFTIQIGITNIEFLLVSGMVLLLSILCIVLPISKGRTAINCVHMIINVIFALAFISRAKYCGVTELNYVFAFLASATLVMHLLLTVQVLYHKKCMQRNDSGIKVYNNVAILITYGISAFLLSLRTAFLVEDIYYEIRMTDGNVVLAACVAAAVLGVIGMLAFIVLFIKKCPEKWAICYYLNFVLWIVFAWTGTHLTKYEYLPEQIALVVLLLISKLLSLKKIKELKVSDAILTTYVCLYVCMSAILGTEEAYRAILLLGGVLFSILFLSQWKTYQESMLTLALAAFAYSVLPPMLKLPAVVGLFFVGILLFNNVNRWKDSGILVYNALALAGQIFCFLMLCSPIYYKTYLTYLCMLIFGLATIILTFDDKYQMNFKGKNMMLAGFLTYMAFVIRTGEHIVNSILLMIVALVCVGIGFAKNQKAMRIYGLVLSLFVCGKIGLYDFMEAPTLQKTILFFSVGVIDLIIAGIYIILEKKRSDAENRKQNNIVLGQQTGQSAGQ